jgi:hypothetical protein
MRTAVTGLYGPSGKCHNESPETTPNSSEKLRQIILKATLKGKRDYVIIALLVGLRAAQAGDGIGLSIGEQNL